MHATKVLQPSNFKRTLGCPGWGNMSKDAPVREAGVYAAEGSVAHALGERCLKTGASPYDFSGKVGWYNNGRCGIGGSDIAPREDKGKHFTFTVDMGMAQAVQVYVDHCRSLEPFAAQGGRVLLEQKLDLSWLVPGMFGTSDYTVIEPLGCLYVVDYKHGAGVPVEIGDRVGDNPQATIYAIGALGPDNPAMVEEVEVAIIQPRAPHPDGPVRRIRYRVEELEIWAQDVLVPAAQAALKPDAPVIPGDWCRWCDAESYCPALSKHSIAVMFPADPTPAPKSAPPAPGGLTGEELDKVLNMIPIMESWVRAVREEAYTRLETGAGNAPQQWKLVPGKLSNRAWRKDVDGMDVYKMINTIIPRHEVFVPEQIKSPPQLETVLKKAGKKPGEIAQIFEPFLAERVPGKPVMVPGTDPRRATTSIEEMFPNN